MARCILLAVAMAALAVVSVLAQTAPSGGDAAVSAWRRAGEYTPVAAPYNEATAREMDRERDRDRPNPVVAPPPPTPDDPADEHHHHHHGAQVTSGSGALPNRHGQVWREYDISPYTARVTTTKRPEQAIVDWILRETGYEVWHSEPLGILSATPRTLRVYHTPQMQTLVADIVDRFVSSEAESQAFSLRVITMESPTWRARALRVLHPVTVQTPGVSAWLVQQEDAAVLLAEWQHRTDYFEHSSPHMLVNNGQSTVVSMLRPRLYARDISLRPEAYGCCEQNGQIDEGFSLEFSPLLSLDRRMIDAAVKCNIDQVERLVPVPLDIPGMTVGRQRAKIEVPQMTHFRFHERFRWPADQVLLIGMGMCPPPTPVDPRTLNTGIPLPLPVLPARADLLVMIEAKGHPLEFRDRRGPERAADRSNRGRY